MDIPICCSFGVHFVQLVGRLPNPYDFMQVLGVGLRANILLEEWIMLHIKATTQADIA